MRRALYLLIFLLLVFRLLQPVFAQGTAPKQLCSPPQNNPEHVYMVMVDESASLGDLGIAALNRNYDELSRVLLGNSQIMVSKFSDLVIGDTTYEPFNRKVFREVIDYVVNYGSTSRFYDAMFLAQQRMRKLAEANGLKPFIILFTDGNNESGSVSFELLKATVNEHMVPVIAFVINTEKPANIQVLGELAAASCGALIQVLSDGSTAPGRLTQLTTDAGYAAAANSLEELLARGNGLAANTLLPVRESAGNPSANGDAVYGSASGSSSALSNSTDITQNSATQQSGDTQSGDTQSGNLQSGDTQSGNLQSGDTQRNDNNNPLSGNAPQQYQIVETEQNKAGSSLLGDTWQKAQNLTDGSGWLFPLIILLLLLLLFLLLFIRFRRKKTAVEPPLSEDEERLNTDFTVSDATAGFGDSENDEENAEPKKYSKNDIFSNPLETPKIDREKIKRAVSQRSGSIDEMRRKLYPHLADRDSDKAAPAKDQTDENPIFLSTEADDFFSDSRVISKHKLQEHLDKLTEIINRITGLAPPNVDNMLLVKFLCSGALDPLDFVNAVGKPNALHFAGSYPKIFPEIEESAVKQITDALFIIIAAAGFQFDGIPTDYNWSEFCRVNAAALPEKDKDEKQIQRLTENALKSHFLTPVPVSVSSKNKPGTANRETVGACLLNQMILFSGRNYPTGESFQVRIDNNSVTYDAICQSQEHVGSIHKFRYVFKLSKQPNEPA